MAIGHTPSGESRDRPSTTFRTSLMAHNTRSYGATSRPRYQASYVLSRRYIFGTATTSKIVVVKDLIQDEMNARPIITRVFASACPTCRNYARRTATSPRTSLALQYSTSSASPSAAGLGFRVANLPYQNRTRRTLRPVLSHLGRSYATASKGPGSSTSIKVIPPTAESLKTSEEFEDAELVPEDQANITVTDDAVKVSLV
jgi:hypothetical protein